MYELLYVRVVFRLKMWTNLDFSDTITVCVSVIFAKKNINYFDFKNAKNSTCKLGFYDILYSPLLGIALAETILYFSFIGCC